MKKTPNTTANRSHRHRMAWSLLAAAALIMPLGCGNAQDNQSTQGAVAPTATVTATASPSASPLASPPAAPSSAASPSPSASNNPYDVAGIEDAAAFDRMFAEVQAAVAADDAEKVAEYVLYPLRVNRSEGTTMVKTKADFIKQYSSLFSDKVKQALADQKVSDLFVRDLGVMVGNGEIWFGGNNEKPQKLGMIALNI